MRYHTAVPSAGLEVEAKPAVTFLSGNLLAIQNDFALNGIPDQMEDCDVIYVEPPWRRGYEAFNKRAWSTSGVSYADFMHSLDSELRGFKGHAYVATGPDGIRSLVGRMGEVPFRIGPHVKGSGLLACYGPRPGVLAGPPMHCSKFLAMLAKKYKKLGDFCCGYGYSGKLFLAYGGESAVLADFNATCIGVIRDEYPNWPKSPADIKLEDLPV